TCSKATERCLVQFYKVDICEYSIKVIYHRKDLIASEGPTVLRKIIYATLIIFLIMEAASAQTDKPGLPGYTNILRSGQEMKNDKEIDRDYQSMIKRLPDAEKKKSDPWGDVRTAPSAATKNKQ